MRRFSRVVDQGRAAASSAQEPLAAQATVTVHVAPSLESAALKATPVSWRSDAKEHTIDDLAAAVDRVKVVERFSFRLVDRADWDALLHRWPTIDMQADGLGGALIDTEAIVKEDVITIQIRGAKESEKPGFVIDRSQDGNVLRFRPQCGGKPLATEGLAASYDMKKHELSLTPRFQHSEQVPLGGGAHLTAALLPDKSYRVFAMSVFATGARKP